MLAPLRRPTARGSAAAASVAARAQRPACYRSWLLALTFGALGLAAADGDAQVSPPVGSLLVDGTVVVKVFVTMPRQFTQGLGVMDVPLLLVPAQGEPHAGQTDDTGTATLRLKPGGYRLVSGPVTWDGVVYHWEIPLLVRATMRGVDLNPRNATTTQALVPAARESAREPVASGRRPPP